MGRISRMMTIYKLLGIYYEGSSMQILSTDPVPAGYTQVPPPSYICSGQYPILNPGDTEATLTYAAPSWATTVLTKYEFRKLFTLTERIGIDNVQANTTIAAGTKAAINTMNIDLNLSGLVFLNNPDVIAGVNLLEQVGLIAVGRAAAILSNTPVV